MRHAVALFTLVAACDGGRPLLTNDATSADAAADATTVEAGGERCARQADCDDGIACTEESCVVGGVCERMTNDAMCPSGQRCFVGRGCAAAASCTRNEDCDDHVGCTRDVCAVGGACQNVRDDSMCGDGQRCSVTLDCVEMGRCGGDEDCDDRLFCNGVERCSGGTCGEGTRTDCADTDMCTADVCNEAMDRCDHLPRSPCGGAVTPGTYDLAPAPTYSCGSGTLAPVTNVMLMTSGAGVTITGFPVTLSGPPSDMGMFTAEGRENRGACEWKYTLAGAFTSPTVFEGTCSLSFNNCVNTLGCNATGIVVRGTRR